MGVEDLDVDQLLTDYPEVDDKGDNKGGDNGGDEANTADDDKGTTGTDDGDDKGTSKVDTITKVEPKEEPKSLDTDVELAEVEKKIAELKDDEVFKLADDWEPESYKKLLEINEKRNALNKEISEAETRVHEINNAKTIQKENEGRIADYNREVEYLVESGRMPKVVDRTKADDAGVKRMVDVRDFILAHNKQVMESNKGYAINSIELGLDLLEMKEKAEGKNEDEKKKKEEALRLQRGSMIGKGTGAKGSESSSKGYVSGTSLDDAMTEALSELE